jgi:HlyD family secretion protein
MLKKILSVIRSHPWTSAVIAIVVVGGGWWWYAASRSGVQVTKYVIQKATRGTVITSVSGSGQMQAVTTVNVAPQVTEIVTSVPVTVGEKVAAGQLLVSLDTTNEARALAQAKLSLQSAQLSLAELTQAPATTTLIQDQNAVTQDIQNVAAASSTLTADYQSGFNSVSGAFVDFQTVMAGLKAFVNGNDISKLQYDPDAYVDLMPSYLITAALPYRDQVVATYGAAEAAYQQNLADYNTANRMSPPATLDALFAETYQTAQTISGSVKSVKDLLNYIVNNYPSGNGSQLPAVTNTLQANMNTYTATINGDVSSLNGAITTISNDTTSVTNDRLALNAASSTLATLVAGPDDLSIQSSELAVQQQELALQTAQTNLDDCAIRAPISGIVSAVNAVIGETVASPAVTIVGQGQVAEVTLNEVDAAKVKLGDPATLTFDALPDVSMAGQVIEIDPVGTVSQGVVDYNVQIALAEPNTEIKPGMSVTANIVTQAAQDVVAVPNAAVTTQGTLSYVLEPASPVSAAEIASSSSGGIVLPASPRMVPVTIGVSNDTEMQILSGIAVGDEIIIQTIKSSVSPSTGSTAAAGSSLNPGAFRALGGGGFGGGRMP